MSIKPELLVGLFAGVLMGSTTTYFVVNRRLEKQYREIANKEILGMKEYYKLVRKEGEYSSPEKVIRSRNAQIIENEGYGQVEEVEGITDWTKMPPPEDDSPVLPHTTLQAFGEGFTEEEKAEVSGTGLRAVDGENEYPKPEDVDIDETNPFIIDVDEFMNNDNEYSNITITYFAEDDILVDEREQIIPDIFNTVGTECLTKFGFKSKDKNIVYVRNMHLEVDFEILLDHRAYQEVVLGFAPDKDRPRKFREGD